MISDMTALLCGSLQAHLGTHLPSGGGHTIKALPLDKHTRNADILLMTVFRLHTRFLLNAGSTLNRR